MGPGCTRDCSFCSVDYNPQPLNHHEPELVARAAKTMELGYVVLTSVTRDNLSDGGALFFVETIRTIRRFSPGIPVEVLVPDFGGSERSVETVLDVSISVFGHNVETVPRLYEDMRKGADYETSLSVLRYAARREAVTKSALILGMGEKDSEVAETIRDLRETGVRLLAIGQYLRPTLKQAPVTRYVTPEEFDNWREFALNIGFDDCVSGPFVRSSFGAAEMYHRAVRLRA